MPAICPKSDRTIRSNMLSEDRSRGMDSCPAVFGFYLKNKKQSSLFVVTIVVLCLQFPDHNAILPVVHALQQLLSVG